MIENAIEDGAHESAHDTAEAEARIARLKEEAASHGGDRERLGLPPLSGDAPSVGGDESYFKRCIGDAYQPAHHGQHAGVHPQHVREAMSALAGRPEADVIAALVKQVTIDWQTIDRLATEASGGIATPASDTSAADSPLRWTPSLTTPRVRELLEAATPGTDGFSDALDHMTRRHLRELCEAWMHVHAGAPRPHGPVYSASLHQDDDGIEE